VIVSGELVMMAALGLAHLLSAKLLARRACNYAKRQERYQGNPARTIWTELMKANKISVHKVILVCFSNFIPILQNTKILK
jgi:hypothetical protein